MQAQFEKEQMRESKTQQRGGTEEIGSHIVSDPSLH